MLEEKSRQCIVAEEQLALVGLYYLKNEGFFGWLLREKVAAAIYSVSAGCLCIWQA